MTEKTNDLAACHTTAELLLEDLAPIGDVTLERRFNGIAVLEDGVMFAYVDAEGTPYLRTTVDIAHQFDALGSHKHPEMRYWTIPNSIAADIAQLRAIAYESADMAHLAISFGVDDFPTGEATHTQPIRSMLGLALLAA